MILQWHYASPIGVQFSQNQAFYYCNEALPIGTYYFEIGDNTGFNWGGIHKGYKYQFTTTKEVPTGGQLVIGGNGTDNGYSYIKASSNWRIRTFSDSNSVTPIEQLTVTEYPEETPEGTSLGILSVSTKYNTTLNNLSSCTAGNNRWKNSAVRQFLNSDKEKSSWYTVPEDDVFARPPSELSTKNGFLTGVEKGLLEVIKPIKISTKISTNRDSERGTYDYTFDKFFIPSVEQIYFVSSTTGEGTYWEYWKQKSGRTTPCQQDVNYSNMLVYSVKNHSSASMPWLRTAYSSLSSIEFSLDSIGGSIRVSRAGNYGYNQAVSSYNFQPACVIC